MGGLGFPCRRGNAGFASFGRTVASGSATFGNDSALAFVKALSTVEEQIGGRRQQGGRRGGAEEHRPIRLVIDAQVLTLLESGFAVGGSGRADVKVGFLGVG